MEYLVINYEKECGEVCDTTIRVFSDLDSAERRYVALMRNAFEETHPEECKCEERWEEFIRKHGSGHTFRYTHKGHKYLTRIVKLA